MNTRKTLVVTAMGLALVLCVSGCAGYGKPAPESVSGDKMTSSNPDIKTVVLNVPGCV
jgi:hypothetical protein